jgi:hypothetical protein
VTPEERAEKIAYEVAMGRTKGLAKSIAATIREALAQQTSEEFLRKWFEQMKADDPDHFEEYSEGGITFGKYTYETFRGCPFFFCSWIPKVASRPTFTS